MTNGFNYSAMSAPSVAKRQLQMSIGAIVIMAVAASGIAFSIRGGAPTANDQVATMMTAPIVVKAAVRSVPSERMQATDQTKVDRRS